MESKITQIIQEKINPYLAVHNGSCEFVRFEGGVVTIRLHGGCAGCPSAKITLYNGITPILVDNIPEVEEVTLEA